MKMLGATTSIILLFIFCSSSLQSLGEWGVDGMEIETETQQVANYHVNSLRGYTEPRLRSSPQRQRNNLQKRKIEEESSSSLTTLNDMATKLATVTEISNSLNHFTPYDSPPSLGIKLSPEDIEDDVSEEDNTTKKGSNPKKKRAPSKGGLPGKKDNDMDNQPSDRIINGHDAPFSYSYFTMILNLDTSTNQLYFSGCGGVLIHARYVLTAAHCVYQKASFNDKVYINAYAPWNKNDGEPKKVIDINRSFIHPKYGGMTSRHDNTYDLALHELKKEVNLSKFPPVVLPPPPQHPNVSDWEWMYQHNQPYTILGFGVTKEGDTDTIPEKLQQATVYHVPYSTCRRVPDMAFLDQTSMICARGEGYAIDACQGDSGGPLLVNNPSTGEEILLGITSWGKGCARDGYPGVYAKVDTSLEWIESIICRYGEEDEDFCVELREQLDAVASMLETATPSASPSEIDEISAPTYSPSQSPTESMVSSPEETLPPSAAPSIYRDDTPESDKPCNSIYDINFTYRQVKGNKIKVKEESCDWKDVTKYCTAIVSLDTQGGGENGDARLNGDGGVVQLPLEEICPQECDAHWCVGKENTGDDDHEQNGGNNKNKGGK